MAAAWVMKSASGAVKSGSGLLVAASMSATGAAYVTLREVDESGAVIVALRLGAAGQVTFCPAMAIAFTTALYCKVESGTVEVTVAYI